MNKKEISEIKKQFKLGNGYFVMGKMATAYINENDEIDYSAIRYFERLEEAEQFLYLDMFRKGLTGPLGKKLIECPFKEESYDEDGAQTVLNSLVNSELKDDDEVNAFIEKVKDSLRLSQRYYITLIFCNYSVAPTTKKRKDDDEDAVDYEDFNFILCTIHNTKLTDLGLYFNHTDKVVENKTNFNTEVIPTPFIGFMYPTFSERTADTNNVMVYTKEKGAPNYNLVNDVLGVVHELGCDAESGYFSQLVREVCGDDLDFHIGNKIYEQLNNILDENSLETEQPKIGCNEIKSILVNSGVPEDVVGEVDALYESLFGSLDIQLRVVNLTNENKRVIKTSEGQIAVNTTCANEIKEKVIDGKKCLVIPIDSSFTLNSIWVQ